MVALFLVYKNTQLAHKLMGDPRGNPTVDVQERNIGMLHELRETQSNGANNDDKDEHDDSEYISTTYKTDYKSDEKLEQSLKQHTEEKAHITTPINLPDRNETMVSMRAHLMSFDTWRMYLNLSFHCGSSLILIAYSTKRESHSYCILIQFF
jgi:hypothetical protein